MAEQRRRPAPTVDVIIELDGGGIVLVERKYAPAGWALPGGFLEWGELAADAACREAHEETSLAVELTELFGVYSDPARDPRGHTISTVYLARARGTPRGGDDAKQAATFALDRLPPLAFDHATILADYAAYRAHGQRPPLRR